MKLIDLNFMDTPNSIAVYLYETNDGPVLFETGPYSCIKYLEKGLADAGYTSNDIKHVFLTHIHLDHAGAAWHFAAKGAQIYVHPKGLAHLIDPTKLVASASKIYGGQMDLLWGKFEPIPEKQLTSIEHNQEVTIGGKIIKSLHTPGHAVHHTAWVTHEGIVCGDVAGVRIANGPAMPPCPPPDIHLDNWIESLDILLDENPEKIFIAHFGEFDNAKEHLEALKQEIIIWDKFVSELYKTKPLVKQAISTFEEWIETRILSISNEPELVSLYAIANPTWISINGLYRYYSKKFS